MNAMGARLCGSFRVELSPAEASHKSVEAQCPRCFRTLRAMTRRPREGWPFAIAPRHLTPEDLQARK